jgi:acetyltransferase-like isoleucine patch superfamily enzyme
LHPNSKIIIGDDCRLVSRTRDTALGVKHPIILRTLRDGSCLRIGREVRASGLTVCAAKLVEIGDRVVIGADTVIADTDFHSLDPGLRSSAHDGLSAVCKQVTIGNDVFIGGSCMILKGATVGDGAVIGAASVVTRHVPPGAVVAGNPARVVKAPAALKPEATSSRVPITPFVPA